MSFRSLRISSSTKSLNNKLNNYYFLSWSFNKTSLASFIFNAKYVEPPLSGWLIIIILLCFFTISCSEVLSVTPRMFYATFLVIILGNPPGYRSSGSNALGKLHLKIRLDVLIRFNKAFENIILRFLILSN